MNGPPARLRRRSLAPPFAAFPRACSAPFPAWLPTDRRQSLFRTDRFYTPHGVKGLLSCRKKAVFSACAEYLSRVGRRKYSVWLKFGDCSADKGISLLAERRTGPSSVQPDRWRTEGTQNVVRQRFLLPGPSAIFVSQASSSLTISICDTVPEVLPSVEVGMTDAVIRPMGNQGSRRILLTLIVMPYTFETCAAFRASGRRSTGAFA